MTAIRGDVGAFMTARGMMIRRAERVESEIDLH